jgi:hypothetical protein
VSATERLSPSAAARAAGGTVPDGTVPGGTLPGGTLPGGTLPGGTVPGGTVPGGTLPGGTVPGGTVPGGTVPGGELALRLDPGALAARIVERLSSEIGGYRRLPRAVLDGRILEVIRLNVELFIACARSGEPPSDEQLEPFRASARDRATEGMGLEDLLHAYRLGGRLAWEELAATARGEERAALPALAGLVMDYLDRVSSAVANSYLEERQHLVSEEERRLRSLLEALSSDGGLRAGERMAMEAIGLPDAERYVPFAASLAAADARAHAQLAARLRGRSVLALTEGQRVTGLAAAAHAERLAEARGRGLALVRGEPCERGELGDALEEVRLAADLARQLGRSGCLELAELSLELLVARSPRVARGLRARVLEPLRPGAGARSPDLAATLRALFEARLERRRAAAALHVHPNTLDYRLRRIEELTGLSLDDPRDLAQVELALLADALGPPAQL